MTQDILEFYAFSADKNAGDGIHDVVADKSKYQFLNKIPNWRRMFSSLYDQEPFEYNGHHYKSFEHAYQSAKFFTTGHTEEAMLFCLESNSALSKSSGLHAQKSKKIVQLTQAEINHWDSVSPSIKQDIYNKKFTLESICGQALIATHDAVLINRGPRIRTIRCTRLEALRAKLKL